MKIADDPFRYMEKQPSGCIEWTRGRSAFGYGRFRDYDGQIIYAHRFVYETANGPIPEGMYVMHSCDNPPCCNEDHLSVGTPTDNARDRDVKGRNGNMKDGKYVGHRQRVAARRKV